MCRAGETSGSEDENEERKPKDKKEFEIKVGAEKQIMSTESESECALSGECAGLDGGASIPSSRRKYSRLNRSVVSPSGDSADGELSEDDRYTGSSGDKTPTSSKKLHKKSPKKSFSSYARSKKVKGRIEKLNISRRLDSSDHVSEDGGDDSDDPQRFRGSRQAAKQASNAISKTISKQDKRSDQEESSSSGSDDSKDLKLRKRSKNGKDSKELKRQFGNESPRKRNDENSRVMSPVRSTRPSQGSTSMSENSDFIMPELEPQISSLPKKLAVMKESESPKSIKKSKSRKEDKRNQKSIREFFSKKANYDNVSSTSSQEDEVVLKKDHKIQRNAIPLLLQLYTQKRF